MVQKVVGVNRIVSNSGGGRGGEPGRITAASSPLPLRPRIVSVGPVDLPDNVTLNGLPPPIRRGFKQTCGPPFSSRASYRHWPDAGQAKSTW